MANKILHKRNLNSGNNPTTASLELGELAINVADGKLFLRRSGSAGDQIVTVGLSSSYALTASYLDNYIPPFPYTGSAQITGSLTVTGSIYTDSTIYSPFTIGLNFETVTAYTYKTPYAFKVNSIESDPSGSYTIIYQASGSTEVTASYVIGNQINKFDKLIITPTSASLLVLNGIRL